MGGLLLQVFFFSLDLQFFLQMSWSFGWEMVGDCKFYTSEGCKLIGIIGE